MSGKEGLLFFGISRATVRSEILIPEFQQFPVDSGTSPGRIRVGHFADEIADFFACFRATGTPRFERWVQYSANPFRCHRTTVSGLTTMRDSRHLCQTARKASPEKPVSPSQPCMGSIAFQDCQLLPQREVFEGQLSLILKPGFKKRKQQKQCFDHDSEACPLVTLMSMLSTRTGFWQRTRSTTWLARFGR